MIKFILIVVSLYLFFRLFGRIILPILVKLTMRRFQTRFYEQNPHLRQEPPRAEGKVTIEHIPDEKPGSVPADAGEYVDYEEIK